MSKMPDCQVFDKKETLIFHYGISLVWLISELLSETILSYLSLFFYIRKFKPTENLLNLLRLTLLTSLTANRLPMLTDDR